MACADPLISDTAQLLEDYARTLDQTRCELALARLMFRAAMDALVLVATAPERYEQIQRELRKDREAMMSAAMGTPRDV